MPLVRRSHDLEIGSVDLSDPMQTVSDDLFLRSDLGLVIHLLKITTAAPAKIGTRWFDPIGRWFDDLFDRSERDAGLHSFDANAQTIVGRSERHHHGLAIGMRQTESARQDSFDCDFHVRQTSVCRCLPISLRDQYRQTEVCLTLYQVCRKNRLRRGTP